MNSTLPQCANQTIAPTFHSHHGGYPSQKSTTQLFHNTPINYRDQSRAQAKQYGSVYQERE